MDKNKIADTIWLIREIKHTHVGLYRVNSAGEPDCSRGTTTKQLLFKGKHHTLKQFVELEAKSGQLSEEERREVQQAFSTLKNYFDKVNHVMAPKAAGTHAFTYPLAEEYCRKRERPDSLLLNWNKGDEIELFRRSVNSFKIYSVFSNDLMNFLKDLIKSCPKAYSDFRKSEGSAQHSL